jgi:hypothetical protein
LEEERAATVKDQLASDRDTAGGRPLDARERVSQRKKLVPANPDRTGVDRHPCSQAIATRRQLRRLHSSHERPGDHAASAVGGYPTGAGGATEARRRANAVGELSVVAGAGEDRP